MAADDITNVFKAIIKNKGSDKPLDEKKAVHDHLKKKFYTLVEKTEKRLANIAFEGFFPGQICPDPMGQIREAMQDHEIINLKMAALAAYETRNYTALRLAGQYDYEIGQLVDFLETYGDLADLNQKMFIRMALSDPE